MARTPSTVSLLLYDSRSGSTLVAALLNRYRGVCVSLESGFISLVVEHQGDLSSRADVDTLVTRLYSEVQFSEMGIPRDVLEQRIHGLQHVSRASVLSVIIEECLHRCGSDARHLVIKHAPFAYLKQVRELLPDVRFIHVVRDGRAVFASKRRTKGVHGRVFDANPLKAAIDWVAKLRVARRHAEPLLEIRYEDVVEDPETTLSSVLDFLGVDQAGRQITKRQADYHERIGSSQRTLHSNVGESPKASLISAWQHELRPADKRVYEIVARAELERFGYQRAEQSDASTLIRVGAWAAHMAWTKTRNAVRKTAQGESVRVLLRRQLYRWKSVL